MTLARDVQTGAWVDVPNDQLVAAYESGRYSLPTEIPVAAPSGGAGAIAPQDLRQATEQGFVPITQEEKRAADVRESMSGIGGAALAGGAGLATGLTGGLLQGAFDTGLLAEQYKSAREQHPIAGAVGDVAGSIGFSSIFLGGAVDRAGQIAARLAGAKDASLALKTGQGIIRGAAAQAVDAAGGAIVSTAVKQLEAEDKLNGELIASAALRSALIGAGAGALIGGVGTAVARKAGSTAIGLHAAGNRAAAKIDDVLGRSTDEIGKAGGWVRKLLAGQGGAGLGAQLNIPGLGGVAGRAAGAVDDTVPWLAKLLPGRAGKVAEIAGQILGKSPNIAATSTADVVATTLGQRAVGAGVSSAAGALGGLAGGLVGGLPGAAVAKGIKERLAPGLGEQVAKALATNVGTVEDKVIKFALAKTDAVRNVAATTADSQYDSLVKAVKSVAGPAGAEQVAAEVGPVAGTRRLGAASTEATRVAAQKIAYLEQHRPKNDGAKTLTPHLERHAVSKRDQQHWLERAEVVTDPMSIAKHITNKTLTPRHVDALASTSPELHARLVASAVDALVQRSSPLPDAERRVFDTLLGVGVGRGSAHSIRSAQSIYQTSSPPRRPAPSATTGQRQVAAIAAPADRKDLQ